MNKLIRSCKQLSLYWEHIYQELFLICICLYVYVFIIKMDQGTRNSHTAHCVEIYSNLDDINLSENSEMPASSKYFMYQWM